MKILITGASGFIGRHFLDFFDKSIHDVYGLCRKDVGNHDVKIIYADLLNWKETEKEFLKKKIKEIDVIIHVASITAKHGNLNDIAVLNNNNLISYNLSKLAIFLGCKMVLNFSSSSVYPNINGEFSEQDQINPSYNSDALYGLSKYNSEIILDSGLRNTKIVIAHLRCAMVYGDGVNPNRIWPVMEQELREKNTITVFGSGSRLINQIHIDKLLLVVEKMIVLSLSGVYNLKEETISVLALAERIKKAKGNPNSKIIIIKEGNSMEFILNCEKIEHLL